MIRFRKLDEIFPWLQKNAKGWCCVIHSNQRMLVNPLCWGDMRLLQTEIWGRWQ